MRRTLGLMGIAAGMLIAAALVAACGGGRDAGPAATSEPASGQSASARELVEALPATGAVTGWTQTTAPEVFGPGNLWEHINGAAETYLAFGFQEAVAAGYTSASTLEATIDLFRMADAVSAFGIYRQELNPAAEAVPVGAEGHLSANVLNFWKGRDYVKITALSMSDTLQGELRALADHVAGALPGSEGVPPEVGFFPEANLVADSVRYVPRDVLSQSYLEHGFEAEYREGATTTRLVTAAFAAPEAAGEALGRYQAFVAASGAVRTEITKPGDGGFVGDQSYYGRVAVVRSGSRLVFALGASSDAAGLTLVAEFLARAAEGTPQ